MVFTIILFWKQEYCEFCNFGQYSFEGFLACNDYIAFAHHALTWEGKIFYKFSTANFYLFTRVLNFHEVLSRVLKSFWFAVITEARHSSQ